MFFLFLKNMHLNFLKCQGIPLTGAKSCRDAALYCTAFILTSLSPGYSSQVSLLDFLFFLPLSLHWEKCQMWSAETSQPILHSCEVGCLMIHLLASQFPCSFACAIPKGKKGKWSSLCLAIRRPCQSKTKSKWTHLTIRLDDASLTFVCAAAAVVSLSF